MTSSLLFKYGAIGFALAFGLVAIRTIIGMLMYGAESGADKIEQSVFSKKVISPLVNVVGGISLLAMIFSGLTYISKELFSSLSWSPKALAIYSVLFGAAPLAPLLLGAIFRSQRLMFSFVYIFFTVPIALVFLIIAIIWALIN